MRIFGYPRDAEDDSELVELEEITVQAEPELLRKVSQFFLETAELVEKHGDSFGHEHLKDSIKDDRIVADIVIASNPMDE